MFAAWTVGHSTGFNHKTRGDQGHHDGGQSVFAAWIMRHAPRPPAATTAGSHLPGAVHVMGRGGAEETAGPADSPYRTSL